MIYLQAFLIGGGICGLAQLIKDKFNLTIGHMTALFVIIGTILDISSIYDTIIQIGGAGALLPITSFGHSLSEAAFLGYKEEGILGIFTNVFNKTAGGISFVFLLSVLFGVIFKPKK